MYERTADAREGALPSGKANVGTLTPGRVNALSVTNGKLRWHTPVPATTY
jgi:hypothetical protein